jgi:hypothetical protein
MLMTLCAAGESIASRAAHDAPNSGIMSHPMATPEPTFAPSITPLDVGDAHVAVIFVTLAVFFNLLFVMITIAQARAQGNRIWWVWGLVAFLVPFAGYLAWRMFGAVDDGSPGQLYPM